MENKLKVMNLLTTHKVKGVKGIYLSYKVWRELESKYLLAVAWDELFPYS